VAGPNIGYATLSIIPSMRGMSKAVGRELGSVAGAFSRSGTAAGSAMSRSFLSTFSAETISGLNKVGGRVNDTLAKWVKRGVTGVVGTALGGLTLSLTKGFSRLRAIDDAQAKLRGLGHTAEEIKSIMDSALSAVRGTAFGLGDAATIAASAVASGVSVGKDLTRYLSLIADTAAIAGAPLAEIGAIINKTTTAQKVYTAELNQLADRGLPVFQWLQDAYGVSAERLREMVSAGEVSSEKLLEVIETNIGGAAKNMGDSWSGAFSNMQAAASRLGAALLGPLFNASKGWFTSAIGWIDMLTERAGPFAEQMAERIAGWVEQAGPIVRDWLGRIGDFIGRLVDRGRALIGWASENREMLMRFVKALVPAAAAVVGLASGINLVTRAWKVLKAATPVGLILSIATGLVYAYQNSERFRKAVDKAIGYVTRTVLPALERTAKRVVDWFRANWPQMQETATRVFNAIAGAWSQYGQPVFDRIIEAVRWVVDWVQTNWPQISAYAAQVWGDTYETVSALIGHIRAVIEVAVTIILGLWERFGGTIMSIAKSAFGTARRTIEAGIKVIRGIIQVVTALIRGDWGKVWDGIKKILAGVWDQIKNVVKTAIDAVKNAIRLGVNAIKTIWEGIRAIWSFFADKVVSPVISKASELRDKVKEVFSAAVNRVKEVWSGLVGGVADFFRDRIYGPVKRRVEMLRDAVRTAFERAKDGVKKAWDALRDIVKKPINAVIRFYNDGIRVVWNKVIAKIPGIGKLGEVSYLNRGGWVPGSGNKDTVPAMLTPGEYVIRKQAAQRLGPKVLDALNRGDTLDPAILGYNKGGFVRTPEEALAWARRQAGKPYRFAAVGPDAYDCSGLTSAIINYIFGRNPHRRLHSSGTVGQGDGLARGLPADPSSAGLIVGARPPYVRNAQGVVVGHTAATLAGVAVEARPPKVLVGGSARGGRHPMFPNVYHLPGFEFLSPSNKQIADSLTGLKKAATNMGEGPWGNLAGKVAAKLRDEVFDFLIKRLPKAIVNAVTGALGALGRGAGSVFRALTPFGGGGVVYGPTAALIGEDGREAVVPLDRAKRRQRDMVLRAAGLPIPGDRRTTGGGDTIVINHHGETVTPETISRGIRLARLSR